MFLNLCIPRHPKANEAFIKDRSLCASHIQWFIFEQIVRHLWGPLEFSENLKPNMTSTSMYTIVWGSEKRYLIHTYIHTYIQWFIFEQIVGHLWGPSEFSDMENLKPKMTSTSMYTIVWGSEKSHIQWFIFEQIVRHLWVFLHGKFKTKED